MSCEHANRALSGIHFNSTATHARFEDKCGDNIRKTTEPVKTVLRDAKLPKNQVHKVELAGDSERFHNVQQLLSYFFNGTEPTKLINPVECMAYGATVVETMPSGNDSSENLQRRRLGWRATPTVCELENEKLKEKIQEADGNVADNDITEMIQLLDKNYSLEKEE
ncbi:hypothetical protein PPTG_17863 [Phytophthora nicotianae INRA-310]|uniref:Uncharacterized protein n=3 Tax=Phytophthora nicotianae TaxID=4792 RepID=W2PK85_PHYN3|nr:hypothetical protein PPTG_17863 [Phytophthora nicotianae INRA-310]ETN00659.1 hypothetical protein PPTG_17863 [Phytophthora nicotianae INRA-310]